jgi:hypothetical protein
MIGSGTVFLLDEPTLFQQQRLKAGLPEMDVRCESFGYSFLPHENERDAIRQAPTLVVPLVIKGGRLIKQWLSQRNNPKAFFPAEPSQELDSLLTSTDARVSIADLQENPPVKHKHTAFSHQVTIELFGLLMIDIIAVLERDNETGVEQDEAL